MSVMQAAQALLEARVGAAVAGPDHTSRAGLVRVVERATFGYTQQEWNIASAMGAAAYVDRHLNPLTFDDAVCDGMLANVAYNTLTFSPDQFVGQQLGNVANQLIKATLVRSIFSTRQLYERLVEFWSDHFNIWLQQDGVTLLKTVDDRDVIRAYALKTFGDLLRASTRSPAMLEYLNNNTNIVGNPNENYARELMELHTMGVGGGYTQNDVREVARCFTGWSYYRAGAGTLSYTFRYVPSQHDTGSKVVLGQPIPARSSSAGIQDGEDVINILLNHPSTAQYISRKLLHRFWGEDPPQALVNTVAQTYQASGGDIKSMVRVVFGLVVSSPPPLKYKRPMHLLVSALRVLGAATNNPASLQTPLVAAGHIPFGWSPPDGYPDTLEYWAGGMLPRWNFGASLMNNEYSLVTVSEAAFLAGATTPQQIVDRIDEAIFARRMSAVDKAQILAYLGTNPSATTKREALGLAVATPGFQWH